MQRDDGHVRRRQTQLTNTLRNTQIHIILCVTITLLLALLPSLATGQSNYFSGQCGSAGGTTNTFLVAGFTSAAAYINGVYKLDASLVNGKPSYTSTSAGMSLYSISTSLGNGGPSSGNWVFAPANSPSSALAYTTLSPLQANTWQTSGNAPQWKVLIGGSWMTAYEPAVYCGEPSCPTLGTLGSPIATVCFRGTDMSLHTVTPAACTLSCAQLLPLIMQQCTGEGAFIDPLLIDLSNRCDQIGCNYARDVSPALEACQGVVVADPRTNLLSKNTVFPSSTPPDACYNTYPKFYRQCLLNPSQNLQSNAYDNLATNTIRLAVPDAPSGLTINSLAGEKDNYDYNYITLQWGTPAQYNKAPDQLTYVVERAVAPLVNGKPVANTTASAWSSVWGNVITPNNYVSNLFNATGLSASAWYGFRVKAISPSAGTSAWSTVLVARTRRTPIKPPPGFTAVSLTLNTAVVPTSYVATVRWNQQPNQNVNYLLTLLYGVSNNGSNGNLTSYLPYSERFLGRINNLARRDLPFSYNTATNQTSFSIDSLNMPGYFAEIRIYAQDATDDSQFGGNFGNSSVKFWLAPFPADTPVFNTLQFYDFGTDYIRVNWNNVRSCGLPYDNCTISAIYDLMMWQTVSRTRLIFNASSPTNYSSLSYMVTTWVSVAQIPFGSVFNHDETPIEYYLQNLTPATTYQISLAVRQNSQSTYENPNKLDSINNPTITVTTLGALPTINGNVVVKATSWQYLSVSFQYSLSFFSDGGSCVDQFHFYMVPAVTTNGEQPFEMFVDPSQIKGWAGCTGSTFTSNTTLSFDIYGDLSSSTFFNNTNFLIGSYYSVRWEVRNRLGWSGLNDALLATETPVRIPSQAPVIVSYLAVDPDGTHGGYSFGDQIYINFNLDTNKPSLSSQSKILNEFTFTPAISDSAKYSAQWLTASTVLISIGNLTTTTAGAAPIVGKATVKIAPTTSIVTASTANNGIPSCLAYVGAQSVVLTGTFGASPASRFLPRTSAMEVLQNSGWNLLPVQMNSTAILQPLLYLDKNNVTQTITPTPLLTVNLFASRGLLFLGSRSYIYSYVNYTLPPGVSSIVQGNGTSFLQMLRIPADPTTLPLLFRDLYYSPNSGYSGYDAVTFALSNATTDALIEQYSYPIQIKPYRFTTKIIFPIDLADAYSNQYFRLDYTVPMHFTGFSFQNDNDDSVSAIKVTFTVPASTTNVFYIDRDSLPDGVLAVPQTLRSQSSTLILTGSIPIINSIMPYVKYFDFVTDPSLDPNVYILVEVEDLGNNFLPLGYNYAGSPARTYTNRALHMIADCSVAKGIILTTAVFSTDLSVIVLTFNQNIGTAATSIDCRDYLDSVTLSRIGDPALCYSGADTAGKNLYINLGLNATIVVGNTISLNTYSTYLSVCPATSRPATGSAVVGPPTFIAKPVVKIFSQPTITLCQDMVLESKISFAAGNVKYVWSISSPDVSTYNILPTNGVMKTLTPVLTVVSGLLSPGARYVTSLYIINALGVRSDVVSITITKLAYATPSCRRSGPSSFTVKRYEEFELNVYARMVDCIAAIPTAQTLTYKWTVTPPLPSSSTQFTADQLTRRYLDIAPDTLAAGVTYNFLMTISTPSIPNTVVPDVLLDYNVTVEPDVSDWTLYRFITGSDTMVWDRSPISLTARIYDTNRTLMALPNYDNQFEFYWTCRTSENKFCTDAVSRLPVEDIRTTKPNVIFAAALPDNCNFFLTVTKLNDPTLTPQYANAAITVQSAQVNSVQAWAENDELFSTDQLVLHSSIDPSALVGAQTVLYQWTLISGHFHDSFNDPKVVGSKTESTMVINPLNYLVWLSGDNLRFRMNCTVIYQNGNVMTNFADALVHTGEPPAGGSFSVTPSVGYAFNTTFTFVADGWFAEPSKLPLDFAFYYESFLHDDILFSRGMYSGGRAFRDLDVLPHGNFQNNYALTMVLMVTDRFGNSVQVRQVVTVYPNTQINPYSSDAAQYAIDSLVTNRLITANNAGGGMQVLSVIQTRALNDAAMFVQMQNQTYTPPVVVVPSSTAGIFDFNLTQSSAGSSNRRLLQYNGYPSSSSTGSAAKGSSSSSGAGYNPYASSSTGAAGSTFVANTTALNLFLRTVQARMNSLAAMFRPAIPHSNPSDNLATCHTLTTSEADHNISAMHDATSIEQFLNICGPGSDIMNSLVTTYFPVSGIAPICYHQPGCNRNSIFEKMVSLHADLLGLHTITTLYPALQAYNNTDLFANFTHWTTQPTLNATNIPATYGISVTGAADRLRNNLQTASDHHNFLFARVKDLFILANTQGIMRVIGQKMFFLTEGPHALATVIMQRDAEGAGANITLADSSTVSSAPKSDLTRTSGVDTGVVYFSYNPFPHFWNYNTVLKIPHSQAVYVQHLNPLTNLQVNISTATLWLWNFFDPATAQNPLTFSETDCGGDFCPLLCHWWNQAIGDWTTEGLQTLNYFKRDYHIVTRCDWASSDSPSYPGGGLTIQAMTAPRSTRGKKFLIYPEAVSSSTGSNGSPNLPPPTNLGSTAPYVPPPEPVIMPPAFVPSTLPNPSVDVQLAYTWTNPNSFTISYNYTLFTQMFINDIVLINPGLNISQVVVWSRTYAQKSTVWVVFNINAPLTPTKRNPNPPKGISPFFAVAWMYDQFNKTTSAMRTQTSVINSATGFYMVCHNVFADPYSSQCDNGQNLPALPVAPQPTEGFTVNDLAATAGTVIGVFLPILCFVTFVIYKSYKDFLRHTEDTLQENTEKLLEFFEKYPNIPVIVLRGMYKPMEPIPALTAQQCRDIMELSGLTFDEVKAILESFFLVDREYFNSIEELADAMFDENRHIIIAATVLRKWFVRTPRAADRLLNRTALPDSIECRVIVDACCESEDTAMQVEGVLLEGKAKPEDPVELGEAVFLYRHTMTKADATALRNSQAEAFKAAYAEGKEANVQLKAISPPLPPRALEQAAAGAGDEEWDQIVTRPRAHSSKVHQNPRTKKMKARRASSRGEGETAPVVDGDNKKEKDGGAGGSGSWWSKKKKTPVSDSEGSTTSASEPSSSSNAGAEGSYSTGKRATSRRGNLELDKAAREEEEGKYAPADSGKHEPHFLKRPPAGAAGSKGSLDTVVEITEHKEGEGKRSAAPPPYAVVDPNEDHDYDEEESELLAANDNVFAFQPAAEGMYDAGQYHHVQQQQAPIQVEAGMELLSPEAFDEPPAFAFDAPPVHSDANEDRENHFVYVAEPVTIPQGSLGELASPSQTSAAAMHATYLVEDPLFMAGIPPTYNPPESQQRHEEEEDGTPPAIPKIHYND